MYSKWPSYNKKIINEVSKVLKSGNLNIWKGNKNKIFEKKFANFVGSKYALSNCNGSVSLEIALKSLGIKNKDEVIVTSKSYFISAACVLNVGAIPVFVDVDYDSQNISSNEIEKVINNRTKAIICVHLGGLPCDMDKILRIKRKYKLKIIEDCAQAHGARFKDKVVGSFGDISCWSFCNDKIMNAGEGGMILTNNIKLYKKAWTLREGGRNQKAIRRQNNKIGFKYIHESLGTNSRMTEIQAVICNEQLKQLKNDLKIRNRNAQFLKLTLKKYKFIELYNYDKKYYNSYYRFYVKFIKKKSPLRELTRNKLLEILIKNKIPCEEGSCSEIYMEKPFRSLKITRKKNSYLLSKESIAFQVHNNFSISEFKSICKKIQKIIDDIIKN